MKIGYARMSTNDQSLGFQIAALKKAGCKKIYEERQPGIGRERPELTKMIASLKKGDVVIVHRLDRLARSLRILLETIEDVAAAQARIHSLSESWADTTSPIGAAIMNVFSGMAQFERDLIKERTVEGRSAAQANGVKMGRPVKLTSTQKKQVMRLLKDGVSVKDVAAKFSVHTATIYRLVNQ